MKGIEQRLPYLQELGIDVIWISPIFRSPMEDNGYDISDYYQVDPIFGTNEDMDSLICEAGKRGIKIILDLVVNHCSDEHEWFQRAVEDENSKEAAYFYFVRTKDGKEPNNWRSNFGGSVWSKLKDGRWYYHTFSPKQPDLNWENPLLRQEIYKMINWWMEKGIAGFRIDAITFIKKDLTWKNREADGADGFAKCTKASRNQPGIGFFLGLKGCLFNNNVLALFGADTSMIPDYIITLVNVLTETAFAFLPAIICWPAYKVFGGTSILSYVYL